MSENESSEACFEIEIDELDMWIEEESALPGEWEDCEMDDEMVKMLEELEEKTEFDQKEFERMKSEENKENMDEATEESEVGNYENDANEKKLKAYLKESRNKNTVKKTEQVIKKFRFV